MPNHLKFSDYTRFGNIKANCICWPVVPFVIPLNRFQTGRVPFKDLRLSVIYVRVSIQNGWKIFFCNYAIPFISLIAGTDIGCT